MAETTEISWAHSTFNPWIGCTKVSPGCDNCYAKTLMDDRYGRVTWGAGQARSRTKTWDQPVRWNRLAAASGKPHRVFCASLADVFDNEVDPAWQADLFRLIEATPALTWMLLTKRIGNVPPLPMPDNVWLGITVVNQDEADRDIPKLLKIDATVRWLSCEPLLGPIDLTRVQWPGMHRVDVLRGGAWDMPGWHQGFVNHSDMNRIGWVIVGGESGANARPMDAEWAIDLRDQCVGAEVPFHFKQWGGVRPKSNGHLLDGQEHRAFPVTPSGGKENF